LHDGLDRLRDFLPDVPEVRPCPVAERLCTQEAVWLPQNLLLGGEQEVSDIVSAVSKIQRSV